MLIGVAWCMQTYEFRVPMCCPKCEEKVREELSELEGVYEVFADQLSERVAVTGFVDPFQALKKMKRVKKKSQFWGGSSSPSPKSSHPKKFSSHTKHDPRHETVYRSSSSQVSHNREPARALHRKNYASYDDGVSYSGNGPSYRNHGDGASFRNMYDSQDDGAFFRNKHAAHGDGASFRNIYGSYDDGVSYRNKHAAHGDGAPFRNMYGSYDDGVSYRNMHGAYDDGVSYRNKYGSYDDGVSYSELRPSSSVLFSGLPRSRSLRYDSVPPFKQHYYAEDYVEEYPVYNRY
jgi:copper chaperone CopZ